MNQKNKQLVPVCYLATILIFCAIVISLVNPAWQNYTEADSTYKRSSSELTTMKEKYDRTKQDRKNEEMHLRSIKQVFQTNYDLDTTDNLVMFGDMFDQIINKTQNSGLLIRSIEYNMKPESNAIFANFSEQYNTCELKFFIVGKYTQLRDFLNNLNNDFPYLLSISKLNITAFDGNTDYILVNMSITLYSKKPTNEIEE